MYVLADADIGLLCLFLRLDIRVASHRVCSVTRNPLRPLVHGLLGAADGSGSLAR